MSYSVAFMAAVGMGEVGMIDMIDMRETGRDWE